MIGSLPVMALMPGGCQWRVAQLIPLSGYVVKTSGGTVMLILIALSGRGHLSWSWLVLFI